MRHAIFYIREEVEVKSTILESFFLGVAFGIGVTVLSLYTQKPVCLAASVETLAEVGRTRRAKEEEKKMRRQRLKAMGFSDEEIAEIYP
jgi:hypothetical protein